MRVFTDTSVIAGIDRGDELIIKLCMELTSEHEALISTVTVSEILTGSYMRKDCVKAVSKAKRVLSQFTWVSLDGTIAEKIAQINSYLIANGLIIEYQDVAIAASCLATNSNALLTENEKHFLRIPALKGKVLTPAELRDKLSIKRTIKRKF